MTNDLLFSCLLITVNLDFFCCFYRSLNEARNRKTHVIECRHQRGRQPGTHNKPQRARPCQGLFNRMCVDKPTTFSLVTSLAANIRHSQVLLEACQAGGSTRKHKKQQAEDEPKENITARLMKLVKSSTSTP